ncbi:MAG: tyrosine-type recombinase/integrase [Solirubrobacterales bacterium]|nr:tyrosine-type recombinase/integrase [Solirubrobacterales bacterium]
MTELWTLAATSSITSPDDPVFIGKRGTAQTPANVSRRLKSAIAATNPKREGMGIAPLSERVTPHSLRRTFASLRYVVGDDPITVGEQGGWSDPSFPMKVYARAVKRREKLDGAALEQFDAALQWAQIGTKRETASDAGGEIPQLVDGKRRSRAGN